MQLISVAPRALVKPRLIKVLAYRINDQVRRTWAYFVSLTNTNPASAPVILVKNTGQYD